MHLKSILVTLFALASAYPSRNDVLVNDAAGAVIGGVIGGVLSRGNPSVIGASAVGGVLVNEVGHQRANQQRVIDQNVRDGLTAQSQNQNEWKQRAQN